MSPPGPTHRSPVLVAAGRPGPPPKPTAATTTHEPAATPTAAREPTPALAPPVAEPLPFPGPLPAHSDEPARWWLLSLLGVMLPAAVAAALPHASGRRHMRPR